MWEPSAPATAMLVITLHSLAPGRREMPSITQSNSGLVYLCLCATQHLSSLVEHILCRCPWRKYDLCKSSCHGNLYIWLRLHICDGAGRRRYMCVSMSKRTNKAYPEWAASSMSHVVVHAALNPAYSHSKHSVTSEQERGDWSLLQAQGNRDKGGSEGAGHCVETYTLTHTKHHAFLLKCI